MHLIAVLNRFSLLSVILYLLVIAVILGIMILLNRNSYQTLLWMFLIVFFPLPGFIIYLILGVDLKRNKLFAKSSWREDSLKQGNFFLTENNLVDVLSDGREAFAKIEQALKEAKDHIHLEFYIIRNDNLGNKIKEILIGKAQEGVEVRVLYDWFGGLGIRKSYVRELRTNGIKVYSFLLIRRYFPSLHGALNYRNHRKIIVVDGKVGFLGGLNIGDEYIDTHRYRYWRDTHLKIEGEAVHNLQKIFFRDWHLVSGEQVSGEGFFPIMERLGCHRIQIVFGGPDLPWKPILQSYFSLLAAAQKSIYLTTPYLIPDEGNLTALKSAALRGVDVRIIIPGRPDKKSVYYATLSYAEELMEMGVKIYCYQKGFIHTKSLIVDDAVCCVGTANFDCRSFQYNYEVNAFIFSSDIIAKVKEDLEKDLLNSELMDRERFGQRSIGHKLLESWLRLFSPYL